jgi:hypothetical protein
MRRWDNENLWLLTPKEFDQLPDGTELACINGNQVIKGQDHIDRYTIYGHLAYGIKNPRQHKESELLAVFMLKSL